MSQFHRFPACRALAAISIVYLTCAFAPAHAPADTAAADTTAADTAAAAPDPSGTAASTPPEDQPVAIAQRPNEARSGIQTQTAASLCTINQAATAVQPGRDKQ